MRTEEVMQRLAQINPVDSTHVTAWPASDRGREVLSLATSETIEAGAMRGHSRRRLRFVVPAVAVFAAAAVVALVLPTPGNRRGASPAAADVLHAAARVAERQPRTSALDDGYRYVKSQDAYRGYYDACSVPAARGATPPSCPRPAPDDWAFSVLVPHVREMWIASDGSGRLVVETGEPRFFGPEDRREWEAAGKPQLDRPGRTDERFDAGELSYPDFSEYSTDPDELYEQLRSKAEGYGPSTDAETLVLVGDLLREPATPRDLRAALYRAAAKIPGVESLGEVEDPAGRKGTAVARTSDDVGFLQRVELIFDPKTSAFLAEREVLLERVDWADAEPGTVIGYAVYLESGVVGSPAERPRS